MIIDAHTHGLHGKYLDKLAASGGDWAKERVAEEVRIAKDMEWPLYVDVAFRVEVLNKYGIDFQVVTPGGTIDPNLCPGNAKAKLLYAKGINDNMARLMEDSKGKLIGIGTVPLLGFGQDTRKEMERAIKTLGLKGMHIPSNIDGKPIDSPEFEPFWAHAEEMDIPVYIHPRDPVAPDGRSYEAEYDLTHNFGWPFETTLALARLVFSGIMERYPALKVVSHHLGGGMIPFFFGRTLETYEPSKQLRRLGKILPRPLFDYFSRFYYDTAVGGSAPAIRCTYEVFGADQIVFATDCPYGPRKGEERLETYPNIVKSLGLSEAENEKIFSSNARKLLNLA